MIRIARTLTALGMLTVLVIASLAGPSPSRAGEPTFGEPTASAVLDEPIVITSHVGSVDGGRVEVLIGLVGREPKIVIEASPGTIAGDWQASAQIDVASSVYCACYFDGRSAPNTRIEYQFRVTAPDGTQTLGPIGQVTVTDERFNWQTLEQDLVRVHWYEGDQAFAQAAADVSNDAIDRASELLGVTLPAPVDLFIYATQDALLEAVSPNRESIAGEAHSTIATMFVWIEPLDDPNRSRVIVAHELTHLVFNENTDNLYHEPPRWLNEGIAVYLSEGYTLEWSSLVASAVQDGSLIPLQGLAGLFPSPQDQFTLAYGESVSAVDYFVRAYSEETLWDLVRSYRDGLSDDDAFTAATGGDMAAFNAAWMASLGADVREPIGPQPAPPGPVPSAWTNGQVPTTPPSSPGASPGESGGPTVTPVPFPSGPPTPRPTNPPASTHDFGRQLGGIVGALIVGTLVVLAMVALVIIIQRSRRPPPPPYY